MRALDGLPLAVGYLVIVAAALLALWVGMAIGQRSRAAKRDEPEAPLGTLVGTLLGLLAFLLGFNFNSAAGRYEARRQLVISEANAVTGVYLRADLLPDPQGDEIRALLREYADLRVRAATPGEQETIFVRSREIQHEIWVRFAVVVPEIGNALAASTALAISDLVNLHNTRTTVALVHRLPSAIWLTLVGLMLLCMASVGYYMGLVGRRRLAVALPLLLAYCAVLTLISDLDRADQRAVSVDQHAMIAVRDSMR